MTAQSYDYVYFDKKLYTLEGDSTKHLPMFDKLGIKPNYWSTADRRGYRAEYEMSEQQLWLIRLVVAYKQDFESFPLIENIKPSLEYNYLKSGGVVDTDSADVVYYLKYPMSISGTITLRLYGEEDRHLAPSEQKRWKASRRQYLKVKLAAGKFQEVKEITEQADKLLEPINLILEEQKDQFISGQDKSWAYKLDELRALQEQFYQLMQAELSDSTSI
jgi:hypothetical protein